MKWWSAMGNRTGDLLILGNKMNIQIFGKTKCFDTKKAERYFKERKIKYQMIDVGRYGMSKGEYNSVKAAVGGLEALIDDKSPDAALLKYLAYESDKDEKLLENPKLFQTPIVRNGKQATVGYRPEIWKLWE
jgi:arsenate reductase (glutaredoxin)